MQFVPLILLVAAIAFYLFQKKVMILITIAFIATNCFGFLSADKYLLSPTDAILITALMVSFLEWRKNHNYFKVKGDLVGVIILVIFAFLAFEFLRTVLFGIDSPVFAYKTVRVQGILLLYFYCRTLTVREYNVFFIFVLICSIIQGVFYYLQPLGLGILQGADEDIVAEEHRYANYPLFAPYFFLCFCAWKKIDITSRVLLVLFFIGMILMAQIRGVIIALTVCILVFAICSGNKKKLMKTSLILLLSLVAVMPVFKWRAQNDLGLSGDVSNIISSSKDGIDMMSKSQAGSMAFRLLMLIERGAYLVDNPKYAALGVGAIHEISPANRFDFIFGTRNDFYDSGRCQIESGDITWVPILLRYGFCGFGLFLALLVCWIVKSVRYFRAGPVSFIRVACMMSVFLTVVSFDTTLFDTYSSLSILCFYMGMSHMKIENKNNLG